jgi:stearoyl-CoA desaturase (delta-9 desaturase)
MNRIFKYFLIVILPQQILGLIALWYLWYSQEYQWLIATFISWFLCYVVGEGIFLHRYFAHKAFECNPILAKIFSVFTMLGGHVNPIAFKLVHTAHHVHTDTEGDPHTPYKSFFNGFIGWHWNFNFPVSEMKRFKLVVQNLTSDPYYVFLHAHQFSIYWISFLLLSLIDFRLGLFTMGLAGAIGIQFQNITNSFGHHPRYGQRRYDIKDNSRNFAWLSWFFWQGAGALQNNHHAFPSRYHDSHAWYEFDIGKWLIPLFATKYKE